MQPRILPIVSGDRLLGVLHPVKFSLAPRLDSLWGLLHEQAPFFIGEVLANENGQIYWHYLQAIIDLHPGRFDLSPAIDDLPLLQLLFFGDARILWLNQYQECEASKTPRPYLNQGQPDWYRDLKPRSSGNYWLDRLADLEMVFGSVGEAQLIAQMFDPTELDFYLYRKVENAIPLEELANEHKVKHFEERMKSDPEAQKWLADSLGVKDYDDYD